MMKTSPKLLVAAVASTLAMAAFAIGAPTIVEHGAHSGASMAPAMAELPAPTDALPFLLRR